MNRNPLDATTLKEAAYGLMTEAQIKEFEADLEMNILYVNQQAFSMFGYTIQDYKEGSSGLYVLKAFVDYAFRTSTTC